MITCGLPVLMIIDYNELNGFLSLCFSELLAPDFTETFYSEDGKPVTLENQNYTVSIPFVFCPSALFSSGHGGSSGRLSLITSLFSTEGIFRHFSRPLRNVISAASSGSSLGSLPSRTCREPLSRKGWRGIHHKWELIEIRSLNWKLCSLTLVWQTGVMVPLLKKGDLWVL